jgi:anti-sigma B factor antagonist
MNKANIMIARNNKGYCIKVQGRATFECCSPIKNFADNIVSGVIQQITIDLKSCTWMDSTFMGTLAILGLHAKRANISVKIINVDEKNLILLKELGIHKLFVFGSGTPKTICSEWENIISQQAHPDNKIVAETILDAHETLISVDKKNTSKFTKVVELVKKELESDNS